jgi:hypothetical protein
MLWGGETQKTIKGKITIKVPLSTTITIVITMAIR